MTHGRLVLAALLAGWLALPIAGCAGSSTKESTGEYLDDSVISNKVRARIVGEKDLSIFQIDVTTFKGVVQLSGFVDKAEQKAKAGQVAASVSGVKEVKNDLVVK
ncbi:MAG: BON domain-containing protein [Alphaproteobacteria bacterium]